MLDFAALRDFAAVVHDGSFTAASRRLGQPKSTISKRVQDLEAQLGVRLLERTTRALRLTSEGAVLHARAIGLLADIDDMLQSASLQSGTPKGHLRISSPQLFGHTRMAAIAATCRQMHPDVTLEIVLGDGRVDLIEDGFDAAIRVGPLPDSTLVARTFAIARNVVVATPDLLAGRLMPQSPSDLATLPVLAFNRTVGGRQTWTLHQPSGQPVEVPVTANITANALTLLRDLCIAGQGIALLPEFVVGDDLAAGRLVRLLPDWAGPDATLSIVYPSGRFMTARLRAFIDVLVAAFPGRSL
jgi:DNA-binding transcriptional LysR family regulator